MPKTIKNRKDNLKSVPYTQLEKDKRAYEIMLLRDQSGETFPSIAKKYNISGTVTRRIYSRIKIKQTYLYINYISVALNHENNLQIKSIYEQAYSLYQNSTYACAYLEKKYNNILTKYRKGEPGMPKKFLDSLPPLQTLSEKTVNQIIIMREIQKLSFIKIAAKFHITPDKARDVYQLFYHEKVIEIMDSLMEKAKDKDERNAIWEHYFEKYMTPKRRYEMLIKK